MAGMDYAKCSECAERLFYDGTRRIRGDPDFKPLACERCVSKMKKKIAKLEKVLRGKR